MKFYGLKKRVRKKAPRWGRCCCGKYSEFSLENERANNRRYKIMAQLVKEQGEERQE